MEGKKGDGFFKLLIPIWFSNDENFRVLWWIWRNGELESSRKINKQDKNKFKPWHQGDRSPSLNKFTIRDLKNDLVIHPADLSTTLNEFMKKYLILLASLMGTEAIWILKV